MQNVTPQSKIKCWVLDIFLFYISYRLFLAPENTTHFPGVKAIYLCSYRKPDVVLFVYIV